MPHDGMVPPQPSLIETVRAWPQLSVPVTCPQALPRRAQNALLLSGLQPQTFGVSAPPQVWGAVQVPQLGTERSWPQLSVPVT
jgi:hypothetical protein